ncbi:hypothetical protein [Micromonospora sp. NPDC050695]
MANQTPTSPTTSNPLGDLSIRTQQKIGAANASASASSNRK